MCGPQAFLTVLILFSLAFVVHFTLYLDEPQPVLAVDAYRDQGVSPRWETAACPRHWVYVDGRCYYPVEEPHPWAAAREHCQELVSGADLAEVDSLDTFFFLIQLQGGSGSWVGIQRVNGTLQNLQGQSSIPAAVWVPHQPDNSGDCVWIWDARGLDDVQCQNPHPSLCSVASKGHQPQKVGFAATGCLTRTELAETNGEIVYTGCHVWPSNRLRLHEVYPTHWVHIAFRYQILRVANVGAHAFGFLVRDHKAQASAAFVKVPIIHPTHHDPQHEIAALQQLSRLQPTLCHRISCLRDAGRFREYFYLSFELVDGVALGDLVGRCPGGLTHAFLRDVMRETLRTIQRVHAAGIVHNDLHAANVLIRQANVSTLRLIDFGMANHVGDRLNCWKSDSGMCGRYFAPPEDVFVAAPSSGAGDMWALGMLLLGARTGGLQHGWAVNQEDDEEALLDHLLFLSHLTSGQPPAAFVHAATLNQHVLRRLDSLSCCDDRLSLPALLGNATEEDVALADLLRMLLRWLPWERPSAQEALRHQWFHMASTPCNPGDLLCSCPSLKEHRIRPTVEFAHTQMDAGLMGGPQMATAEWVDSVIQRMKGVEAGMDYRPPPSGHDRPHNHHRSKMHPRRHAIPTVDAGEYHPSDDWQGVVKYVLEGCNQVGGLPQQEGWGAYRPQDQPRRWEILAKRMEGREALVADFGSNFGFFSVHAAARHCAGRVFSVQRGDAWETDNHYFGALPFHRQQLVRFNVSNNVLCNADMDLGSVQRFIESDVFLDYQLVMSIIHWFPLPTQQDVVSLLGRWLSKSRTTFLELPSEGGFGKNTDNIRRWFADGSTQRDLVAKAAVAANLSVTIRLLGEGFQGRKLFEVRQHELSPSHWDCSALWHAFHCAGPCPCRGQ
eukprot:GGOE01000913.1.p1 GENE.GGOE01000913.1~~GGOE01000913.1.p1  ORF type:complete len:893 (+),score=159.40 GGOE01000913.1:83-2761(+)